MAFVSRLRQNGDHYYLILNLTLLNSVVIISLLIHSSFQLGSMVVSEKRGSVNFEKRLSTF